MNSDKTVYPAHHRSIDDKIQTVEEHLIGVSEKCSRYANHMNFYYLGKLLGILHDIGKFTDEFYTYFNESVNREKEGKPILNSTIDHGKYGAMLILEQYHNGNKIKKLTAEIISMIICYHHGGMEDFLSDKLDIKLFNRCEWDVGVQITDHSYITACNRFFDRVMELEQLNHIFNNATEEVDDYLKKEDKDNDNLYFNLHLLTKYLYSCLIDADRYDTYLFIQEKKEGVELNEENLWQRFSSLLKIEEERLQNNKVDGLLAERIKRLRHDIWQQCNDFGYNEEGIYTLTVPTGGGKTLSSLRYALNHAITYKKKRIVYILPYTSIIEQNAGVVRDILGTEEYLLEHHSNIVDDRGSSNEITENRQLITERWDVPIIFTTMVQFLNTFYAKGTKNIRRFHNLTDTILIFDEIQAIPIKCISLFNSTINFLHHKCKDTIILCSATQPNLKEVKHNIDVKGEIIQDVIDKFHEFKRVEIIDARYNRKMSMEEAGDFITELVSDNQSILIVMNTKKTAEGLYKVIYSRLKSDNIIFYFLSTRLCPKHRKDVIKEMKINLGQGKRVICVSTQLIEAGVDISFSCVVRHLAGMDSVAQAFGRGNRHGEGSIRKMYIFQLAEENLGSLEDIKLGKEATIAVLDEYRRNNEIYNNDLLSPQAITSYYSHFFNKQTIEDKMDYPIYEKSINKTVNGIRYLYAMFTSRNQQRLAYRNKVNKNYPLILATQFKTASILFDIFEEFTEEILVPYSEGLKKIEEIRKIKYGIPSIELIRSTQPFMVNISKGDLQLLKDRCGVYMDKNSGVWVLEKEFYDETLGVVMERSTMEVMLL